MPRVSWAGSAKFGGHDYLRWGWDLLVVAMLALVFFIWGVKSGWSTPAVQEAAAAHGGPDGRLAAPLRGGTTPLQAKDALEPQVPT